MSAPRAVPAVRSRKRDADAGDACASLTAELTVEGDAPVVEREGERTPVLCGDHAAFA